MQYSERLSTVLIWFGVVTPALLSLYFIFQFGLNAIFGDEWAFVPLLELFITGENWLQEIPARHNTFIPIFPRLIVLEIAYLTSYNIFYELIVGWMFVGITVFFFWLLVRQTVPEAKWIIIPIAWLTYSFSHYEVALQGYTSIAWNLSMLSIIASIYFLNRIKFSPSSVLPAIIFGFIGTFSHFIVLLIWLIGLLNFRGLLRSRQKTFVIFLIAGITSFILYYIAWNYDITWFGYSPNPGLPNDYHEWINYVLAYLGNGPRIGTYDVGGLDQIHMAMGIGACILSIFVVMNVLCYNNQILRHNHSIKPWLQIALFGLISALVTGIARVNLGPEQALSPRYVLFSNLFLEGTIVLSIIVLMHMIKTSKTKNYRNILRSALVILLILLCINIAIGYVAGWVGGSTWNKDISVGASCLMEFESASDDCLRILFPFGDGVREWAKILQEFCLGPFATKCN